MKDKNIPAIEFQIQLQVDPPKRQLQFPPSGPLLYLLMSRGFGVGLSELIVLLRV